MLKALGMIFIGLIVVWFLEHFFVKLNLPLDLVMTLWTYTVFAIGCGVGLWISRNGK